ncbi:MAG: hypothetical protein IPL92_17935 [Saprospiraceae bacterium]|nr:hypothetical protein [Candidatus Opimibacter iunctus]
MEEITVFLSQSFHDVDKEVVQYFENICEGLKIRYTCFDIAASGVLPETLRNKITDTQALIAICSQRSLRIDGTFDMSPAIRTEIDIAFALEKPVLLFCEENVFCDIIIDKLGTWISFSKSNLSDPDFMRKVISSINEFKLKVSSGDIPVANFFTGEYYIQSYRSLISLENKNNKLIWSHYNTKRLIFRDKLQRPVTTGVWPCTPTPIAADSEPGNYSITIDKSSKHFDFDEKVNIKNFDTFEASIRFIPDPDRGDWIEWSREFSSQYINPLSLAKTSLPNQLKINVDGKDYYAFDGITPDEPTANLLIKFSFDKSYGLSPDDIRPIAIHYGRVFNYHATEELTRVRKKIEYIRGNLSVELEVTFPKNNLMYGLAWNPPIL